MAKYLQDKVQSWCDQLVKLSVIAQTQPHAAYAAYIHGFQSKWTYLSRTMSQLPSYMQPLEDVIREKFIPGIFGSTLPISDDDRAMYALPAKMGGMGIANPVKQATQAYKDSKLFTTELSRLMLQSATELPDMEMRLKDLKLLIKKAHTESCVAETKALFDKLSPKQQRAMTQRSEKGAPLLLTAMPLEKHGLTIHSKRDFKDMLHLYGLAPKGLPIQLHPTCACGRPNSIDHSQSCQLGGFIIHRHDKAARLWASLSKQAHCDVEIEPHLQPLTGEVLSLKTANCEAGARSDVRVTGFWRNGQSTFFDFKVINLSATSHFNKTLKTAFRESEAGKRREYLQRINEVEGGSFTPMVMAAQGGCGAEMQGAIKKLAGDISRKSNQDYSAVITMIRTRFTFLMARSAVLCLRGSRDLKKRASFDDSSSLLDPAAMMLIECRLTK